MGILRRIESRLESVFEGGFSRTFKSNVQPVELARKLAKEMDDHRTISVSQVYVPNIYTVFLAPEDREQFATYEASLRTELAGYLAEHARREAYTVPGRLRVLIETAEELDIGSFGIAVATQEDRPAPVVERRSRRPAPAEATPPGADDELPPEFRDGAVSPVPRPVPPVAPVPSVPVAASPAVVPAHVDEGDPGAAEDAPGVGVGGGEDDDAEGAGPSRARLPEGATLHVSSAEASAGGLSAEDWELVWDGGRHLIDRRAVLIGRGRDCDVVLADGNASRRHAELVRQGPGWVVRDLDSTNGTAVNGRRVRQAPVAAGDAITIGTTTLELQTKAG